MKTVILLFLALALSSCANTEQIEAWRSRVEGTDWTVKQIDIKQNEAFLGSGGSYTEAVVESGTRRWRFRLCNESTKVLAVGDVVEFHLDQQKASQIMLPDCWFDAVRK